MLGKLSGPSRNGVVTQLRMLCNQELDDLHVPPSVRAMNARTLLWTARVTEMMGTRNSLDYFVLGNLLTIGHLEDRETDKK
jgi:hypothetical protein